MKKLLILLFLLNSKILYAQSCSYTENQYMTTWFGDEVIRAYVCGSTFYAKNGNGDFKSKSWLIGTGRFTTAETNCF